MIQRRTVLGLLSVAAVSGGLAACGGDQKPSQVNSAPSASTATSAASSAPAAKQELTFALSNEPDGLDPGITSNSFASPYLTNLVEGLVTYNAQSELVAGLAEKWDISADGKTYTFTLRKGLKWSDGSPLTAKDFEYSYLRLLDPKTTAQYVGMLTDYVVGAEELFSGKGSADKVGIKATDDTTLTMTLKAPAGQFLGILSMWTFAPVQKATVEKNGDKWTLSPDTFVTSGPFKVSSISLGDKTVLVKNEHYWNAAAVKLNQITFTMIKNLSTALNAFKSGEVQGARSVPLADFATLKASEKQFHILPTYAASYYLFNCQKAPFDNPKVRKAFALAIDRQSLIDNVMHSTDTPAFSLIAPGYKAEGKSYEDGRPDFGLQATANAAEAAKLLAEAGYPEGKGFPAVELYYYTDDAVKLIAEAMAEMLRKNLGIKVTTPTKEWKVYYSDIQAGKFQVAAMGWGADYLNPMTFFPQWQTGSVTNNSGWSNPEYDKFVIEGSKEVDPVKQMAVLRQAEDVLMANYPGLPLYYRSTSLLMSDKVTGWFMTPLSSLYLREAQVSA